ncbi:DNA translocase FtsK [Anaerolineales bacterium HSG25]|nr:DNA translocase FtsK [Anaerolineales bacterium HSG25]
MTARKKKANTEPTIIELILARLDPYRRELIGAMFLLAVAVTFSSIFSITTDNWSVWWAETVNRLLGWGVIPTLALLAIFGLMLTIGRFKEEYRAIPMGVVVGLEILLAVGLAIFHLLTTIVHGTNGLTLAQMETGGGLIGWGIGWFFVELFGPAWAIVLLSGLGLFGLALTFRVTIVDLKLWATQLSLWAKSRLAQQQGESPEDDKLSSDYSDSMDVTVIPPVAPINEDYDFEPMIETVRLPQKSAQTRTGTTKSNRKGKKGEQLTYLPDETIIPPPTANPQLVVPAHTAKKALATMPKAKQELPPLDVLTPSTETRSYNRQAKKQALIIQDTLKSFDIPNEVVNWQPGPTVTQFEIKLGTIPKKGPDGEIIHRRIRVRKVMALTNDLALALSATPIRIEAPIPGKPLVGIEVPNKKKSSVSLYGVMDSDIFADKKAPLQVALGRGISGDAAVASLVKMPHLLIAGATGSGKSVCLNSLITTLIMTHSPEQLRLLMVDPKMVELISYNGIPHLVAPVVTDFEQVVGALSWATREMERRYKLFAQKGARSISSFNKKAKEEDKLAYLVVIIDELADLMMMAPDEVERHICRIAQMARATGIHLVIATQRPSTDVITGLIKANFPARIAFAVTSQIDSRVILDTPGAEKLLGQGDMLYMAPDSAKLVRLQGCYVSDADINKLVKHWHKSQGSPTQAKNVDGKPATPDKLPWTDIMAEAEKDDLLEEAVKLVVETRRASTSFLQRRLGIGYPRASRLMDQLEEEGVVGPAEGSKPRQVLWREEKDEADYAEFQQDVVGD